MEHSRKVIEMCSKNTWTIQDIMDYEDCSKSTAYIIKAEAVRNKCGVRFRKNVIDVDKFLMTRHNTTREREIAVAKFTLADPEKLIQVTIQG